jgi:hypothetical protein
MGEGLHTTAICVTCAATTSKRSSRANAEREELETAAPTRKEREVDRQRRDNHLIRHRCKGEARKKETKEKRRRKKRERCICLPCIGMSAGVGASGLPLEVDGALQALLKRRDTMQAKEARNEIAFDATAHLNLAKELLALASMTPELVIIDPALELLEGDPFLSLLILITLSQFLVAIVAIFIGAFLGRRVAAEGLQARPCAALHCQGVLLSRYGGTAACRRCCPCVSQSFSPAERVRARICK